MMLLRRPPPQARRFVGDFPSIVEDLSELVRENKVFKMGSYLIPQPAPRPSQIGFKNALHSHTTHTCIETNKHMKKENQFPKTIR